VTFDLAAQKGFCTVPFPWLDLRTGMCVFYVVSFEVGFNSVS
jgi:hypothetical protein